MLDTMTMTKVTAALCGSLLVFLLSAWLAEEIYHIGGHGDGKHGAEQQAYSIEVEDPDDDVMEMAEDAPSLEELLAVADVTKGERVWGKCRACHQLEAGANGTGPYLLGIVGRSVSAAQGFRYSGALAAATNVWNAEALNGFLENPRAYAPGTSMNFAGLKKAEDRANLIAYLMQEGS